MFRLNFYKLLVLLSTGAFLSGCYTQFAMYDGTYKNHRPPTDEETYYQEEPDTSYSDEYYPYEDSMDYAGDDETYFENNYYSGYPSYHRYYSYYYPSFTMGFSYGSLFYDPFCWDPFFPNYCYTPYIYYSNPYYFYGYGYGYGYPYYSYGNYYSHYSGNYFPNYKYRDNNRFSLRNSSGLRNSYTSRDPLSSNTNPRDGDFSKINNTKVRDVLTVSSSRNNRGTNNTVPNKNSAWVDETKKITRTYDPKVTTKEPTTINRNPIINKGNNKSRDVLKDINKYKGNQTPKIKTDVRNTPPKVNGTEKKTYQTPKNYNSPKNTYKPPTKNNPPTKTYSPPTRNYSPPNKTYSPPTRSYSPPPRNSGNNSGSTRKNTR